MPSKMYKSAANKNAADKLKEDKEKGIGYKKGYYFKGKRYNSPEEVKVAAAKWRSQQGKDGNVRAKMKREDVERDVKAIKDTEAMPGDREKKLTAMLRKKRGLKN